MSSRQKMPGGFLIGLRADWREIGGLGRMSLVGIGIAAIVTVILGFSIASTVRNQLLSARAALIETAVADLSEYPLVLTSIALAPDGRWLVMPVTVHDPALELGSGFDDLGRGVLADLCEPAEDRHAIVELEDLPGDWEQK